MPSSLMRLQCAVNSYEWGKKGSDSCAARYAAATAPADFSVEPNQPYAELWMGTHPSNPSYDTTTGRTLLQIIQDDKTLVSPEIVARFGRRDLPFLFKILSIRNALSIQAHPNKSLAKQLHARDPVNYPDENHKPEMAIAITPFEALCGFRQLHEISHFLDTMPSLRELIGEDEATSFQQVAAKYGKDISPEGRAAGKNALQRAFAKVMNSSDASIESASRILVESAKSQGKEFAGGSTDKTSTSSATLSELVCRLYQQYGPDHGLFVLFFVNFLSLQPGEAIYLQADDIHAYVSGDIVECMATSDNVVRAGFTNRFKDVPTLVDMLTYDYSPIEEQMMKPATYPDAAINEKGRSSGSFVTVYDPPIDEFAVVRSVLKCHEAKVTFPLLDGPSVIICTGGKGTITVGAATMDLQEGYIFFVGSGVECSVEQKGDDQPFEVYKALCEVKPINNVA